MSVQAPPEAARLADFLSKEERKDFLRASNVVAAWQVAFNYALIVSSFALAGLWPNAWTIPLATLVLGGRYVGLGILNHDAAHNALFRTKPLNAHVARWLFAGPTLIDFDTYRAGHLSHHRNAGTLEDPDIPFVAAYPVEPASMKRKIGRDLTGRTGIRDAAFLIVMTVKRRRIQPIVVHAAMFGALYLAGFAWAYALWWLALVFVVPVCLRLRVMGEHGNVPNLLSADVRDHARTTHAGLLARLMIAPNYVNYHCEHHFFASVPGHKLPALHRLLVARGFYEDHPHAVADSYSQVLGECVGDRDDRPDLGDLADRKASLSNMA